MPTPVQIPFPFDHRPALGPSDYLVTDCNRYAALTVDRWPDWAGMAVALVAPPRGGKTHLLNIWAERAGATVLSEAVPAALAGLSDRTAPAIAIDDIDRMVGRADVEEALFHLWNAVWTSKGTVLMTARSPPTDWMPTLPDLASRMNGATVVQIADPDDTLISALLVKRFGDRQIRVAPEVVGYISQRIHRRFDAVDDVLARLDYLSLSERRPITVPLARRALIDADAWFGDPAEPLPGQSTAQGLEGNDQYGFGFSG